MAQGSAPVLGPRGAACPGGAGINSECFFFLFFFCRIKNLNIYPRPLSCYPMIFVNLLQNKRSRLLPPRSPLCSRPGGVQHPRAGSSRALCRAGRGAAPGSWFWGRRRAALAEDAQRVVWLRRGGEWELSSWCAVWRLCWLWGLFGVLGHLLGCAELSRDALRGQSGVRGRGWLPLSSWAKAVTRLCLAAQP